MTKNIFSKILFAFAILFTVFSCEDRELVTVDNESAAILMDLSTETLVLDKNYPNNPALTITWDAATYSVPTEIIYKVEVSTTSDFATTYTLGTFDQSITKAAFTAVQMNDAAGSLGLSPNVAATMYFRVISYLGTSMYFQAVSNVTSLLITPYVLDYPDFYLVGGATFVGWSDANSQLLYKSGSESTIYTYLENGQSFRFLGQQAWNPTNYSLNIAGVREAYRYFNSFSSNLIDDPDNDENIRFDGETGVYKVTIDAASGVQSITAEASSVFGYDFSEIYLVGSMNSWSETSPLVMSKVSTGIYEWTGAIPDDAEFKFIGQKSWGALDWGNINTAGNTGYLGPKDSNGNIQFDGGGSTYKITVNVKGGVYSIVAQ